jgi:alkylation response protein AidB-like acyl-CoA dehydrogenase
MNTEVIASKIDLPIIPRQFHPVQECEVMLECSLNESNSFAVKNILALDETSTFPTAACKKLNEWGMNKHYIPCELGGKLQSFETILFLIKMISRRDLTVAIGHAKTFLGASPVWVAGSNEQKEYAAKIISSDYAISLALTEKNHGSDLAGNEVSAEKIDGGYLVSGEKWLINNATRGKALSLFCRTNEKGGMRAFSVLFLDKDKIDEKTYQSTKKIPTHGIRGADISGIIFNQSLVSSDALIGKEGEGLEITLKSLQISRSMCCGLSLGAGDAALRTTLTYVLKRKLYDIKVAEIKYVKEKIIKSFVHLILADSLSLVTMRALHFIPHEMSMLSSIAKYFVPATIETFIADLSTILGSRAYLRDADDFGIFQKIQRDNKLVGLFDGSAVVNLQNISSEIQQIAKKNQFNAIPDTEVLDIFTLNTPVKSFNAKELSLSSKGKSKILSILLTSNAHTENAQVKSVLENLKNRVATLLDEIRKKTWALEKVDSEKQKIIHQMSTYLSIFCFIKLTILNPEVSATVFQPNEFDAFLQYLNSSLINKQQASDETNDVIWNVITRLHQENKLFSLIGLTIK